MGRTRWLVYLWPGLPQLYRHGSWSAFAAAIAAAAGLNFALLGSLVWSELVSQGLRNGIWMMLGLLWAASAVTAVGWNRRQNVRECPAPAEDGFQLALDHYLKGDWFETERVLGGMLRRNARDVDARLMLASLLRHTRRHDEALSQLDLLAQLEGAEKWELEIRRERELLANARTPEEEQTDQGRSEPSGTMLHAA